ncbi:MAG: hypothetical protein U0359_11845 [Byssovorax sp.]
MRRRLLLAAFAIPLAVLGSTHGCSDEPPVEDYCAFMANTENCYSQFHKDLGAACGSEVDSDVQGSFASRAMLDICVLSKGGQAVFDPPIDLTKTFPGDKALTIKLITPTGLECGSISYASQFSFSLTINPPPGADAGVDGGQVGSGENVKYLSGTVSSSELDGRGALDVGCSAPDVAVIGDVLQPESHHFNRYQVTEGADNNGCAQFADIIPQAIVELNPGGVDLQGSLKVKINFPPVKGVKNASGDSTAITPESVYYLDCQIPGAVKPCQNGTKDGAETDTDCGGGESSPNCPARCAEGQECKVDCDCDAATLCKVDAKSGARKCTTPAAGESINKGICSQIICANKVQDSSESDVDCGGVCPGCDIGRKCNANTDCTSGNCEFGVCTVPRCDNNLKDGTETDVDCGGGGCPACDLDKACVMPSDCKSEGCTNGVCTLCGNKKQDPPETDVDCGGNTCGKCGDGLVCLVNDDCLSNNCYMNTCISCSNGKQDGQETDVDCGGPACAGKCDDGKKCLLDADCANSICLTAADGSMTCDTCSSGAKDGSETDVDCGGGFCGQCADGATCVINVDCVSGKCIQGVCAASCNDGTKNGTETDIDCGGTCSPCQNKKVCANDSDCTSMTCINGLCYAATCRDGALSGTETAADCGGGDCPTCADGLACKAPTDCQSNGCVSNKCNPCGNGVKDGAETDIDCGGIIGNSGCATCAAGKSCSLGSDCTSGSCTNATCD